MFYIIESTCEVVGRRPPSLGPADSESTWRSEGENREHVQRSSFPVRADWSAYIARRVASGSPEGPLLSRLKWACQESYDKGMGRLWLKKVPAEGTVGRAKLMVAERYVLACVTGNR